MTSVVELPLSPSGDGSMRADSESLACLLEQGTVTQLTANSRHLTFDTLETIVRLSVAHRAILGIVLADEVAVDKVLGGGVQPLPRASGIGMLMPTGSAALITGHGDGLHIHLGDAVLCGVDVDRGDQHGTDCSYELGVCRKRRVLSHIIYAHDLKVHAAFLLSCNSVNVAQQLDPAYCSIAVALLRNGTTRSVLGATRQLSVADGDVSELVNLWNSGSSKIGRAHV